jgi:hypothetical protein
MSNAVIAVHMPEPLLQDAARQAQRVGVSVEDWLLSLASESVRYEYVADRFFRHPANPDAGKVMLEVLDSTNDHPPLPGANCNPSEQAFRR